MNIWLLLLALPTPNDQLLASSFQPAAIQAYQAVDGVFEAVLGPGSPLAGTLGSTLGPDGLLYVASEASNEILRFEPASGAFVDAFVRDDPGTPGDESGGLDAPSGVVFGPDARLYVGSFEGDAVLAYDGRTGAFGGVFVQAGDGNLNGPDSGMAFGPDGHLYVPSFWNNRVKRYDGASGTFLDNFLKPDVSGLSRPRGVFFVGDGTILAMSEGSDQVLRFDALSGDYLDVFIGDDPGTTPDESGGLDGPTGLVRMPDGTYWLASLESDELKRYAADGMYIDTPVTAGSGGLSGPVHLTLRPRTQPICEGSANSVGAGAALVVRGSTSVSANDFRLELSWAPTGELAVFAQGGSGGPFAVGDGLLCLGGPVYRLAAVITSADGRAVAGLDLSLPPAVGAAILPGSSWDFQVGYRDPSGPGGSGLNFSSSLRASFGL